MNTASATASVVILDGKNGSRQMWEYLSGRGAAAHIFVADREGTFRHNPGAKGNDYSAQFRDGEIACIQQLHQDNPVAAVVVIKNGFSDNAELSKAIRAIHEKVSPDIKIIVAGASPAHETFGDGKNEISSHPSGARVEPRVFYAQQDGIGLAPGIAAVVPEWLRYDLVYEALLNLRPEIFHNRAQAPARKM